PTRRPSDLIVKVLQRRNVHPKRVTVLHAHEYDALAGLYDPLGVVRADREFEHIMVPRDHGADFVRALQCRLPRGSKTGRRSRSLRSEDGEEPAVQSAFHHAWIIDLG